MEQSHEPAIPPPIRSKRRRRSAAGRSNESVRVVCPLCHKRVRAGEGAAGKPGVCSACGLRLSPAPKCAIQARPGGKVNAGLAARSKLPRRRPDFPPQNAELSPAEVQNLFCGPPLQTSLPKDLKRWLAGEPMRRGNVHGGHWLFRTFRQRPYLAGVLATTALVVLLAALVGTGGYCYHAIGLPPTALRAAKEKPFQSASERSENRRVGAVPTSLTGGHNHGTAPFCPANDTKIASIPEVQSQPRSQQVGENRQGNEAQRVEADQSCLAAAQEQAEEAAQVLSTCPQRSALLASQSLRARLAAGIAADRLTEQILRDALAQCAPLGFVGHEGPVRVAAITPDGRRLATGSDDRTVRIWNLAEAEKAGESLVLGGHQAGITALALSGDGRRLVSADAHGEAIVWDLMSADPAVSALVLSGHTAPIRALALSGDGRWLLSGAGDDGAADNTARLWDLRTIDPAATAIVFRGDNKPILAVGLSPNNRWAITAGEDGTIRRWNLAARTPAAEQTVLRGHQGCVTSLMISPDGHRLASGSYDGTARIWDLDAPNPSAGAIVLRGHEGWLTATAFSPDGHRLATGSFDMTVRLWDLRARDPSRNPLVFEGHAGPVRSVAFSPDGRWLVSGSVDCTARIWDLTSADPPHSAIVLHGHTAPIGALCISPTSRCVVTGGGEADDGKDYTVRVWDLRLDGLLQTAQRAATENRGTQQQNEMLLQSSRQAEALR